MIDLLLKLLTPKVLIVYGPLMVISILLAAALGYLWSRHETLHDQRLEDAKLMQKEYASLVAQVDKTLDLLIRVLKKRNE